MLRRVYDWCIAAAYKPYAPWLMGLVSFVESSFFPIPPDVMLIPMVLANRNKAFTIAAVCTVTSVLGGLLGYAIGYYFFETIGDGSAVARTKSSVTVPESVIAPVAVKTHDVESGQPGSVWASIVTSWGWVAATGPALTARRPTSSAILPAQVKNDVVRRSMVGTSLIESLCRDLD